MNIFGVEFWGIVHMENILRQLVVGGEVVLADKTFRVEELLDPRIAPDNGNGSHMRGLNELFRAPTCPAGIFEGEVEAVAEEPIDFDLVAVTRR